MVQTPTFYNTTHQPSKETENRWIINHNKDNTVSPDASMQSHEIMCIPLKFTLSFHLLRKIITKSGKYEQRPEPYIGFTTLAIKERLK